MTKFRPRILIADDEADHRYLLKTWLLEGWALEASLAEARDGHEAFEKTRQWRPHLIFMDLLMPQMSGYEAIWRIRELEQERFAAMGQASHSRTTHGPDRNHSRTWIIALTADVLTDSRSQAYSAGCDDFVTKPYTAAQLYAAVEPVLARWLEG